MGRVRLSTHLIHSAKTFEYIDNTQIIWESQNFVWCESYIERLPALISDKIAYRKYRVIEKDGRDLKPL